MLHPSHEPSAHRVAWGQPCPGFRHLPGSCCAARCDNCGQHHGPTEGRTVWIVQEWTGDGDVDDVIGVYSTAELAEEAKRFAGFGRNGWVYEMTMDELPRAGK